MKKRLIAMILSAGAAVSAVAGAPKEGGLCFRFDDNKTVTFFTLPWSWWRAMAWMP